MDLEKREILLREIEHWRQSRLLPEQYCDFLSNLYQEQEQDQAPQKKVLSLANLLQGHWLIWLLGFFMVSLICFIGFYFNAFPLSLQIFAVIVISIACYGYAAVLRSNQESMSALLSGLGSLIMIGTGMWMIALHHADQEFWFPVLIGICGVVWCMVGIFVHIGLLHYCGLAALFLIYALFFVHYRPTASIELLELFWIFHGAVMLGLSWLVRRWLKNVSVVYFGMGITLVFMPEADSILLRHHALDYGLFYCVMKVAITISFLFLTRKKWIAWVTS